MKKLVLISILTLLMLAMFGCERKDDSQQEAETTTQNNSVNDNDEEDNTQNSGEDCSDDATLEDSIGGQPMTKKPVIYLYPEEEMEISVKLDYKGKFTSTYPVYKDGWNIVAKPDGTLYSEETGREYYCLFWEGVSDVEYDFSKGFVVPGNETEEFLEEKLAVLGLTEKEANEFIIYWLPQMEGNAYNLISFQDEVYTDNAKLEISPSPDTVIRVFMAWQRLDEYVEIEPQELESVERVGFTVVEWGGSER